MYIQGDTLINLSYLTLTRLHTPQLLAIWHQIRVLARRSMGLGALCNARD